MKCNDCANNIFNEKEYPLCSSMEEIIEHNPLGCRFIIKSSKTIKKTPIKEFIKVKYNEVIQIRNNSK